MYDKFKLPKQIVNRYKDIKPNFGFNGLGEITYYRTYSRLKENGENEQYYETVERVVNTLFSILIEHKAVETNSFKYLMLACTMYDLIFNFKITAGRAFWALEPKLLTAKGGMALNNCAFVSTKDIDKEPTEPFTFLMDVSMLGVGCGFDVRGAGKIFVKGVNKEKIIYYVIKDTREGWVNSVEVLLNAYFFNTADIVFDYSKIRPYGTPIKTFGGVASGSAPLEELHKNIRKVLTKNTGFYITETTIVDIMNMIGVCVIAGNVRRTAEIAFGTSDEFMNLKNYELNPERNNWGTGWGWTSNNTIFAEVGQDYSKAANLTAMNGEPGYFWLENAQNYSRMNGVPDYKDKKALGANPCNEQTLESFEVCNLVETYPSLHENDNDYYMTLFFAVLFGKIISIIPTRNQKTDEVVKRNRRIGISMTGIVEVIAEKGMENFKNLCETGYDHIKGNDKTLSELLEVPCSVKLTSVKPSGTVSLLAGVSPGLHYPNSPYYIRRIRLAKSSPLVPLIKEAGYFVEDVVNDIVSKTVVVEIPIKTNSPKTQKDVTMREQLDLAAFMQRHWADNQVSCTVTFTKDEAPEIEAVLKEYETKLKGISFLPALSADIYPQMPYETITEDHYNKLMLNIKPIDFSHLHLAPEPERFCDSNNCEL